MDGDSTTANDASLESDSRCWTGGQGSSRPGLQDTNSDLSRYRMARLDSWHRSQVSLIGWTWAQAQSSSVWNLNCVYISEITGDMDGCRATRAG